MWKPACLQILLTSFRAPSISANKINHQAFDGTRRHSHSRAYDGSLDNFGYSGQARLYADYRPAYPEDLLKAINEMDIPSTDLYVDACCGSGQLLCKIAPRFKKAVGVDR
jgi:hypothetical protein